MDTNTDHDRRNKTLLFLSGLVLGGAAVFYLHTPRGKRFSQSVIDKGNELTEDISIRVKNFSDTASKTTADLISKAKNTKDQMVTKVENKTIEQLDKIEKGIHRAKAKLGDSISYVE